LLEDFFIKGEQNRWMHWVSANAFDTKIDAFEPNATCEKVVKHMQHEV
jgi:hypothetical protein